METSDRGLLDVERFDLEPKRPVFHGLLGELRASDLVALSTHAKVPHVLRILEPEQLSARMAASMAEIDYTLTTWPQLGGDVTLGGATVAAAVRRIGRGLELASGRVRIDVESALQTISSPSPATWSTHSAPAAPPAETEQIKETTWRPRAVPDLAERLQAVLRVAMLAPSGGNTQPWAFALEDRCWSIDVDPSRSSTMDVRMRASFVAAGAALFNSRIGAARHGVLGSIELFPDPRNELRVATVRFGEDHDGGLASRYEAMLRRCTNRQPGRVSAIEGAVIAAIEEAAQEEGAKVHLYCAPDAVAEIGRLLGESDRLRYLSPVLHLEMMSELRWPGRDSLEVGLDVRTLELDSSDLAKLDVARRGDVMECLAAWGGGAALGEVTRNRVVSSSAIAVVTIPDANPVSYVHGGSAVERLWITAEEHGLSVQPVSPVFIFALDQEERRSLVPPHFAAELEGLNAAFRELTGIPHDERFVLVLRLSHASPPTTRSRRLPLPSVLRSAGR
jgi:nitroreductase